MMRRKQACAVTVFLFVFAFTLAAQSVYPTGTTTYDPARAWNGYTVLSPLNTQAAIVIDMNGNVVKQWDGYVNSAGGPARIFPNGVVMAANGTNQPHQESVELIERDFEGRVLWRFDHNQQIQPQRGGAIWSARQHHDWQREDFPAGYYSPGVNPGKEGAKTLILTHTNDSRANVADAPLEDDRLIEVSWNGDIVWEWLASDHIDELGFSAAARNAIKAAPGAAANRGFDWLHINSASYIGPNHWFDEGDQRFAPNNVLISSRQASFLAIVGRDGKIVWRLGPDFSESKELRAIGQIIGQHNAHIIPKGLPGEGNLMVFDNGGASGYGFPNPNAPNGANSFARASSRVLEINPVKLELVWSYTGPRFYGSNISGAQRLANGNTLITEGPNGRVFEVTKNRQIVWEYIYPAFSGANSSNSVYRAYRLPYDWIPQVARPNEQAVAPPSLANFRVPKP
jgi:hypothetical protein